MQTPVVICGYKRSPFTLANKGALAKTRPDDMAAEVIKALIKETGVNPNDIEGLQDLIIAAYEDAAGKLQKPENPLAGGQFPFF